MLFITQCNSPALWQTYLSDPASITMGGILIFNKHVLFSLTIIILWGLHEIDGKKLLYKCFDGRTFW